MRKIILAQFIVLLAGTLFAWFNFGLELYSWLQKKSCTTGCAAGLTNPFLTPCFWGAIFFSLAFILSCILVKKSKQK